MESHLVGKLTSIRTILPRGRSPPLCFSPSIPPTQYIPDSHPPSFILPDLLSHHVSAPHLSSSRFLLSFLISPLPPRPLSVITLNLSSSAVLFCDGNLSFWENSQICYHQLCAGKLTFTKIQVLAFRVFLIVSQLFNNSNLINYQSYCSWDN